MVSQSTGQCGGFRPAGAPPGSPSVRIPGTGFLPLQFVSGGADPTCAHRERHPRFRTLTQRSVLTDAQTDWAGKWARRGTCMALESTLVPFVWPRTAASCNQGPPSVEPRWHCCSVQIQIQSDSTSGCQSEPYLPAMCTPISTLAPISCGVGDLQNQCCRKAALRGRIHWKIRGSNHKVSPQ